jgi:hypothetical protein
MTGEDPAQTSQMQLLKQGFSSLASTSQQLDFFQVAIFHNGGAACLSDSVGTRGTPSAHNA